MNWGLIEYILAQRHENDDGGWMRILVYIVIVVLWVLGGIAKKRRDSGLKLEEEEQEQPPHKPAGPERPSKKTTHPYLKTPRPGGQPSQPVAKSAAAQALAAYESMKATRQPPGPKPIAAKLSKRPRLKPLEIPLSVQPEAELRSLSQDLQRSRIDSSDISESPLLSNLRAQLADTEKLRMVILYHEIIGQPVSLRQPRNF